MFKLIIIALLIELTKTAIPFNPLLTYSIRFKKLTMHPNFTGNYTIDQYRDKTVVNAYLTINSEKMIDKAAVVFHRCNPEGFNCEYFQTWMMTDLCSKLKDKNQMWSSWYASFDPPMVCPINNINYRIKNGTIEIGPLVRWYPDVTNYSWKVTQKFMSGDIFVGSNVLEFSIFGYRKRIF